MSRLAHGRLSADGGGASDDEVTAVTPLARANRAAGLSQVLLTSRRSHDQLLLTGAGRVHECSIEAFVALWEFPPLTFSFIRSPNTIILSSAPSFLPCTSLPSVSGSLHLLVPTAPISASVSHRLRVASQNWGGGGWGGSTKRSLCESQKHLTHTHTPTCT